MFSSKSDAERKSMSQSEFLDWVMFRSKEIQEFANIIETLSDGGDAISLMKAREVMAKFVSFNVDQVSFLLIYQEHLDMLEEIEQDIYSDIYMEYRDLLSDKNSDIGQKYSKKSPTVAEVEMEMRKHIRFQDLLEARRNAKNMKKKVEAQEKYMRRLERLDNLIINLLKSSEVEVRHLHLT